MRISYRVYLKSSLNANLKKRGYSREKIDYLGLIRMKQSGFGYAANEPVVYQYGQPTHFEEWGHLGQNDPILFLEEGLNSGRIKD